MSSFTSSSSSQTRRVTVGIPNRCWCGSTLTTFGSKTKENLFRRFYRCEIGVRRQNEDHLFKWIDEAIIDEINMVDAKVSKLQADFGSFMKSTSDLFDKQENYMDGAINDIKNLLQQQTNLPNQTIQSSGPEKSKSNILNIATAAVVFGTMAFIYAKLSN
ncbi:unnamed protein product [Eruca vesicaria subsp. sativa]|uniref:GRF-type domain-containing protein n=1 Tax=Eruca vesicaria subsp. sativa TaxID=29727 RepID=A0ABC8LPD4_ERUVS|nr:unnamed protein product [Eruca vesicaria subsp. sativa]